MTAADFTPAREHELMSLIENLELAHDLSRGNHVRAAITAAVDHLWQRYCELCEETS